MYANMRIVIADDAIQHPDAIARNTLKRWQSGGWPLNTVYAHEVAVNNDGSTSIRLDVNDGGNYAEDGGVLKITGRCWITADF